jgi:hypothetical protein
VTFINGPTIRAKRVSSAAVIILTGLTSVLGCATVPTEPSNLDRVGAVVAAGSGAENGGWRAWAYRTRRGDLCVEVRGTDGGGYNCGQGEEALHSPGIVATEKGTYVIGGTLAAGAASARLDDADGSRASANLVAVDPVAAGLRVYVLAVPESARPQRVVVLDPAGTVIESAAVGR